MATSPSYYGIDLIIWLLHFQLFRSWMFLTQPFPPINKLVVEYCTSLDWKCAKTQRGSELFQSSLSFLPMQFHFPFNNLNWFSYKYGISEFGPERRGQGSVLRNCLSCSCNIIINIINKKSNRVKVVNAFISFSDSLHVFLTKSLYHKFLWPTMALILSNELCAIFFFFSLPA